MKVKANASSWYSDSVRNLTTIHLYFAVLYFVYTLLSRAWNVITFDATKGRLFAVVALTLVVLAIKLLGSKPNAPNKAFIKLLVLADILFASFNIYFQRGMASRAVALYALPIIVAAFYLRLRWLVIAAALSAVSYAFSAWLYFNNHFNEGYKAELVFEVGFYSLSFFVLAALLWSMLHRSTKEK